MGGQPQHHGLSKHSQVAGLPQPKSGRQGKKGHSRGIKKAEITHEPRVPLSLLLTGNPQRVVKRGSRGVLPIFVDPLILTVVWEVERDFARRELGR